MISRGALLCLASAAGFGAMAVFGKLSYAEGATVGTLLTVRFALAAVVFWALALMSGAIGRLRSLGRRDIATALVLGAIGYAAQAGAFFTALERIDASLLSLLLYTFPVMVMVAAIALGRERADRRRVTALGLTSAGLVLVVGGAGSGSLDPLGVALALAAAVIYSAYILGGEGVAQRVPAILLSAIVCSAAAATLAGGSALLGELRPAEVTPAGWGWMACIAAVSTVAAVGLFFAGLRLVGPSTAAILSTLEPVVTVVLAFLVFGERLGPLQMAGGALVLGGVLVLNARLAGRSRTATHTAAPEPSPVSA